MNETSVSVIPQAVEKAVAALEGLKLEAGLVKTFASALFSRISHGGLDVYTPETLAELAIDAFRLFERRERDTLNLAARDFDGSDETGPVTVVEIVNDDMPFLLSSVLAELNQRGLRIRFIAHPVLWVQRDGEGQVTDISIERVAGRHSRPESVLHIQIERIGVEARANLADALREILREVRVVVSDWKPMLARLREAIDAYSAAPPPVAVDELAESIQFLKWLADGNFTLLGMRSYNFVMRGAEPHLEPDDASGLGLLRNPERTVLRRSGDTTEMSPEARDFFTKPAPLIITKASFLSPVHRRLHVDSIGVKLYAEDGTLTGELRIAGLFSASAYNDTTRNIPFLCHKINQVFLRSGNAPNSYSGRMLQNILETFPRDELFQISTGQLLAEAQSLLELELMPRTRVFVRLDEYGRFASVLIYVRRDRFTTEIRERIVTLLEDAFGGQAAGVTPFFTIGPLVRLHAMIWAPEGRIPDVPAAQLEAQVRAAVRTWRDELGDLMLVHHGRNLNGMLRTYGEAFPPGYEHANPPERAIKDIERLEKLSAVSPVAIDFFHDPGAPADELRVMLYQLDEPISLSRRVPVLEHLGFSVIAERTFELSPVRDGRRQTVFLHDMLLETANGQPIELPAHDERLEECFLAVWHGVAGNDRYNSLIVQAGLTWREVALMRAYGSYLRQIGAPFSQTYLATTLNRHGDIVRNLLTLFQVLFDPAGALSAEKRAEEAATLAQSIEAQFDAVSSLDEDRMLRRYLNLIQATIRTNFFQKPTELTGGPVIALKISSAKVEALPAPRPFAEIFVTSPRFEGIHLRGGPIARGGLRWSDRPQDFRTEILGLAKAQQVKNAIIVPQGAKGGFAPRLIPKDAPREAAMAEGVACYRSFVANLLSVTDNLKDGEVAPPAEVERLDADDPYLVVAADKGTATFSDIANAVAVERDFWLGDAFASGGSAGYDHKRMGITARGAWEAVKRHFREMNVDIQAEAFDVVGVGDMSGDVFGNGMLLSRQIRLVAAFDHRDIFIDPDPDPEKSWAERKRLFDMPRSSWQDYDRALISAGGGIFSRAAKSIPLTAQMQRLLGAAQRSAPPADVIRLILKARAGLLWFGGIGTYIRASAETDEEVNDRANDAIRITAREVNAKVVGEGANLGVTQRGRIEFAQGGGRINTDAIDNSAGVNTSDVEVNIKIALAAAVRSGRISREERDRVLAAMTDEVAVAVLQNNILQTLAISLGEHRGLADLGFQLRLMHTLEHAEVLDRAIERLPSDADLAERRQKSVGLTRPELAVLLAYAKIALYFDLMKSPVLDEPYLCHVLADYFPATMRERFAAEIDGHALRREIIATVLTNAAINRGGSTFAVRLAEETGREPGEIACAFATAMGVFRLAGLYEAVDGLGASVDGGTQLGLHIQIQNMLRRQTAWFLRHGVFRDGLSALIARYRDGVDRLNEAIESIFDEWLTGRLEDSMAHFGSGGVPPELARRFAHLAALSAAPDIITLAIRLGRPETDIARIYFQTSSHFRLEETRAASEALGQTDHDSRLALNSTLEAVASAQRMIVAKVYAACRDGAAPDFVAWCTENAQAAARARRGFDDILSGKEVTLAKLTVAVSQLRELAEM